MTVTSTIAKVNSDRSISAIFCNWDGDLAHVGKILLNNYYNEEQIDALLELGNLTDLGETIGGKVDFYKFCQADGEKSQCLAFERDRGEHSQPKKRFNSRDAYERYANQDYNYLFEKNCWIVKDSRGTNKLSSVVRNWHDNWHSGELRV